MLWAGKMGISFDDELYVMVVKIQMMILLEVWTWRLEEVSLTANLSLTPGTKSHRAEEHTQLWSCNHHHLDCDEEGLQRNQF